MGLFWVMEEGMIAHCELFHETSMCECLCVSRREICPCKTKRGLFLNFREFIISRSVDYIFNAVVQVETGQKAIVVVVVGILPMINTKGFASPLLLCLFYLFRPTDISEFSLDLHQSELSH